MLLAGWYPGDLDAKRAHEKLRGLVGAGIRYIINLMEEDEVDKKGNPFIPYHGQLMRMAAESGVDVTCVRIPIKDMSVPPRLTMARILDEIDQAIAHDLPVYVHCWGGRGRTGTVVGCYLARHGIAVGHDALNRIQELRRITANASASSPETEQQREMVCCWKVGE